MFVIYFRFSAITNYFSTHRLLSITLLVCRAFRCLLLLLLLDLASFLVGIFQIISFHSENSTHFFIIYTIASNSNLWKLLRAFQHVLRTECVSPFQPLHTTYSFISLAVATSFFYILAAEQFFPACQPACLPLSLSCYSMNAHNS